MAALTTTLALIGIGAAAAAALKPTDKSRTVGETRRSRGDAPIVGRAVPRGSVSGEADVTDTTPPAPPPSTLASASQAYTTAQAAADRVRKRAAAGGSALSKAYQGKTGPRAVLQPKTLIGG